MNETSCNNLIVNVFALNSYGEIEGHDSQIVASNCDPYNDLIQQYIQPLNLISQKLKFSRYPNDARRAVLRQKDYRFSLSHAGKRGILILAPHDCCIGIDLHYDTGRNYDRLRERVVRESEQHFLTLGHVGFNILWALKESALKAWGIGMRVAPWDVEVQLNEHQIMIHNLEQKHLPPLCGGFFSVAKNYIVGYSWLLNGFAQVEPNFFIPRPIHLGVGKPKK